jgi:hypothetical protein
MKSLAVRLLEFVCKAVAVVIGFIMVGWCVAIVILTLVLLFSIPFILLFGLF